MPSRAVNIRAINWIQCANCNLDQRTMHIFGLSGIRMGNRSGI